MEDGTSQRGHAASDVRGEVSVGRMERRKTKKNNPISVDENWKLNARTSLKKERARDLASAREEDATGAAAGALRIAAWPVPRTAAKALILVLWPPVRPAEAAQAGPGGPNRAKRKRTGGRTPSFCQVGASLPVIRSLNGGVTGYGG